MGPGLEVGGTVELELETETEPDETEADPEAELEMGALEDELGGLVKSQ